MLETTAVSMTIVVALSDTQTGRGYLGHFTPDSPDLNDMIEKALRQANHPYHINVWYGGAAFVPPPQRGGGNPNGEIRMFRIKVSRLLATKGFRVRDQKWLRQGESMIVRLLAGSEHCAFASLPPRG